MVQVGVSYYYSVCSNVFSKHCIPVDRSEKMAQGAFCQTFMSKIPSRLFKFHTTCLASDQSAMPKNAILKMLPVTQSRWENLDSCGWYNMCVISQDMGDKEKLRGHCYQAKSHCII